MTAPLVSPHRIAARYAPDVDDNFNPSAIRVGYLAGRYPALSHPLMFREIAALRKAGIIVEVSSINHIYGRSAALPEDESAELCRVFCIRKVSVAQLLAACLRTVVRRPKTVAHALRLSLRHAFAGGGQYLRWAAWLSDAIILGDWLAQRHIGHLHAHFATEVSNVGYLAAKIFDIDFSMTVDGPDEIYDANNNLLNRQIETAALLCCTSMFTRSQLMKFASPDEWYKIRVVRFGVDPAEFNPQPFRIKPDVFEILCVGRLVPAKGQHVLLEAVAALSRQGYKIRLRLVGDGPDRGSLERHCVSLGLTGCVEFEGAVHKDRIGGFVQKADLFVLASFAEGLPVVLMEAMASEVACVSTAVAGIPELIRDGINGLLVPSSDQSALEKAIARLIEDPSLRRRLGRAGRARLVEQFEIHWNVTLLRKLFHECIPCHRTNRAPHERRAVISAHV
ncbi:MAG: glycosyltransferase [Acidobacteriota bacterium]|nr:glycosyltransferase [Acidobacteriota bacterium]